MKVNIEIEDKAYGDTIRLLALKYNISRKRLLEIAVRKFWEGRVNEAIEYRKDGKQVSSDEMDEYWRTYEDGETQLPVPTAVTSSNPEIKVNGEEAKELTDDEKEIFDEIESRDKAPWEQ